MMARFNYIVPGILTPVGNPGDWDYRAQLWLYSRGYGLSAGLNYYDDVLGGVIARNSQAAMVASDLRAAASKAFLSPIVAVGHSNGCYILVDALKANADLRIDELHLIAAAVPSDCDASALNAIAQSGRIKKLVLYVSPVDEALGIGALMGYGDLGKVGPVNSSPWLQAMTRIVRDNRLHSDWVYKYFDETMQAIVSQN